LEGREWEPTNPNPLTDLIDLDGDDDIDDERGRMVMVELCGWSLGDVPSTSSDVPVRRGGCWPQRALMVSKKPMQHPSWAVA
jgi:hypothetical protein